MVWVLLAWLGGGPCLDGSWRQPEEVVPARGRPLCPHRRGMSRPCASNPLRSSMGPTAPLWLACWASPRHDCHPDSAARGPFALHWTMQVRSVAPEPPTFSISSILLLLGFRMGHSWPTHGQVRGEVASISWLWGSSCVSHASWPAFGLPSSYQSVLDHSSSLLLAAVAIAMLVALSALDKLD